MWLGHNLSDACDSAASQLPPTNMKNVLARKVMARCGSGGDGDGGGCNGGGGKSSGGCGDDGGGDGDVVAMAMVMD